MKKSIIALLMIMVFIMQLAPAFAAGFSSDPDAVEQAAKSVLMLEVIDADNDLIATGSGFVAFNNRTIVTNYHVIEDADWIMAHSDDGYEYMVTKVLIADEEKDIAICSFMSPTDLKPLEFNVDGELKRIESVVAIGSPKGLTNTISLGNISALFVENGVSQIQFTAPISAGSSGGALFDDNGNVIGVTSAIYDDEFAQNINFAVHISEVEKLYQSWDGTAYYFDEYAGIVNATPTPKPTATPRPTLVPSGYITLQKGDSGENVRQLQEALIYYGYLRGSASGMFDSNTEAAVKLFNQFNLHRSTAKAFPEMQKLLFDGYPLKYNPYTSYVALRRGDRGENVKKLQKKLIWLGYLKGTADGVFGEKTEQAVFEFSRQHFQIGNKVATSKMQKLLFEGNPKKK